MAQADKKSEDVHTYPDNDSHGDDSCHGISDRRPRELNNAKRRIEKEDKVASDDNEMITVTERDDADTFLAPPAEVLCPRINCPEKILLCLDLSNEMSNTYFRSRVGDKLSALKETKKALKMYIMNKSKINSKHEFALAVFHDCALLIKGFTSKPREIITFLDELESPDAPGEFDLTGLFELIQELTKNSKQTVQLPDIIGDVHLMPPPYIVRIIFIYGRSQNEPQFTEKQIYYDLDSSPYFFVDVLYVHEPPSDENKCEEIFSQLCDLDHKGLSYILEAASLTRLFDSFAKLLPHPLQRPLQRQASYHLSDPLPPEEQVA